MARKLIAPLMSAILAAAVPFAVLGCHAEAHLGEAAPPPQPPPPPPVASAPAPAPTPAPVASAPAPAPAPTPAPAPPPAPVTVKGGTLGVPGNIVYETGKAIIKPESEPTLNSLKAFLDTNKTFTRIRIEGHTDNVGKSADNLKLSVDRALAVEEWLVAKGVPRERLLAVGFGDARPIAPNTTDDGKAQNRRTEFHIAELGGKPFGGKDETGGGTVATGQAPVAQVAPKK